MAHAPQPAPQAEARIEGRRVIFWLFVWLAIAAAAGLWMFSLTEEGAAAKPIIWRALAGNLTIPVVAWFILSGIAATDTRRRWTWWGLALPAGGAFYWVTATVLLRAFA